MRNLIKIALYIINIISFILITIFGATGIIYELFGPAGYNKMLAKLKIQWSFKWIWVSMIICLVVFIITYLLRRKFMQTNNIKQPIVMNQISSWLQGGPFLEISFILNEDNIRKIISKLSSLNSVYIFENNLEDLISSFEAGYFYDEHDLTSQKIHTLCLKIIVDINGKRKALLYINLVAEHTILMDFCFFGCDTDAPEWDQIGIKEDEYYIFNEYLSELLEYFQGIVGCVDIEKDVLDLISDNYCWPNNIYSYKTINPAEIVDKGVRRRCIGVGIRCDGKTTVTSYQKID